LPALLLRRLAVDRPDPRPHLLDPAFEVSPEERLRRNPNDRRNDHERCDETRHHREREEEPQHPNGNERREHERDERQVRTAIEDDRHADVLDGHPKRVVHVAKTSHQKTRAGHQVDVEVDSGRTHDQRDSEVRNVDRDAEGTHEGIDQPVGKRHGDEGQEGEPHAPQEPPAHEDEKDGQEPVAPCPRLAQDIDHRRPFEELAGDPQGTTKVVFLPILPEGVADGVDPVARERVDERVQDEVLLAVIPKLGQDVRVVEERELSDRILVVRDPLVCQVPVAELAVHASHALVETRTEGDVGVSRRVPADLACRLETFGVVRARLALQHDLHEHRTPEVLLEDVEAVASLLPLRDEVRRVRAHVDLSDEGGRNDYGHRNTSEDSSA